MIAQKRWSGTAQKYDDDDEDDDDNDDENDDNDGDTH